ncbi:4Fe-4S dicluster domain-containing protein [Methylacidiphilum caldifontis]|uniref:4Fe-4S dicluster domain-containing protein n=1 Tax=Methylacidiphilum caldifontis TaxID=2795386 RepID=UPI001A8C5D83|nr:4Fe-4S dicluster domain-containing protein [Methylacidiphilum caldifontis]QSR89560.1 4Fe-4S dicluster domain-containing protein [Methylacidiphilum caldifontis]
MDEMQEKPKMNRRSFLKTLSAAVMATGTVAAGGCRRPEAFLVPYTNSPEWIIPGKATFYATCRQTRSGAEPLLVESHEGRPTHIHPNPHFSEYGVSTQTQASILDLYDPDRDGRIMRRTETVSKKEFISYFKQSIQQYIDRKGAGLAILSSPIISPTFDRLKANFLEKCPQSTFAFYDPVGNANRNQAIKLFYGSSLFPVFHWQRADLILSLGCDFCSAEEGVEAIRGFTQSRKLKDKNGLMNRLYVVENRMTVTGSMADHRLALKASDVGSFLLSLCYFLVQQGGYDSLKPLLSSFSLPTGWSEEQLRWIKELARDLNAAQAPLVIINRMAPVEQQIIVFALNEAFGQKKAMHFIPGIESEGTSFEELCERIKKEQIKELLIIGANPVYNAPADMEWEKLQKSLSSVIHFGILYDETASAADWHIPLSHYLESWGDSRTSTGIYVSQQPLIEPLFGSVGLLELLAFMNGNWEALEEPEPTPPSMIAQPPVAGAPPFIPIPIGLQLVQETFFKLFPTAVSERDFRWRKLLHDGFYQESAPLAVLASPKWSMLENLGKSPKNGVVNTAALELVFYPCPKVDEGSLANNGWLQELPDAITKLCWDNALLMSPNTAKQYGINGRNADSKKAEIVRIGYGGKWIEAAVYVIGGHADYSFSIALGYGRKKALRVAGEAGFNAYPLTQNRNFWWISDITIQKTSRFYLLAKSQEHQQLHGRDIVKAASVEYFRRHPDFVAEKETEAVPEVSIYQNPYSGKKEKGPAYTGGVWGGPYQWGMVIDLGSCVGCNSCVVACQSENNIPIVGKGQVMRGRIMQWIRIDNYFQGPEESPQVYFEPMLCQQCENAPCEAVCPVYATVHSKDGLNVMVYNRCIGTRACAANCPYKVRRFNFFDYNKRDVLKKKRIGPFQIGNLYLGPFGDLGSPLTIQLQRNPNVTVRMRGVMEKCTFCVQRIEEAKIAVLAKAKGSPPQTIPTDKVKTACQAACPAEAIVFGNLADPQSAVSQWKKSERAYRVLEELNTRPRITYLARINNPNPSIKPEVYEKEKL